MRTNCIGTCRHFTEFVEDSVLYLSWQKCMHRVHRPVASSESEVSVNGGESRKQNPQVAHIFQPFLLKPSSSHFVAKVISSFVVLLVWWHRSLRIRFE